MSDLVPGGNLALPEGALAIEVAGPFDLSALVTGEDGKVGGDGDFVFYNQPTAPGVRLRTGALAVDRQRLRPGASRITVVLSPADPHTPLGRLPAPAMTVTGPGGRLLARFSPPPSSRETVLLLAEVYRRGTGWKLRALGQGYADGLAGVARDFGVDVAEDRADEPREDTSVPGAARDFTVLVNALRAKEGVAPVAAEPRLVTAAGLHAAGMARQGRLDAEGPEGLSVFQRVTACGYSYLSIAEHLVSGPRAPAEFADYCTSDARARGPLVSAAYSDVGVAHATDPRTGTTFWTAVWARPLTADGLASTTAEVLALTNAERASAGLPPLSPDTRLSAAAQAHSTDMAVRDFYSHTSPEGREPWDRAAAAGCPHRAIGENIACGQRSPSEVVEGWMNSPGHRANILKPDFTHLGIGFAGGGRAGTYWTQLFGGAG
ncbi:uncharacterized protein YkwD [Streptomyces olivoverticillatus]|uniref:Uncharacterized protein YkwD n=1 Tax=Streptomyces olivoverticillatus TaxID=66427 RepID=A0A7W7LNV7_9ACTN|nr:CAP domain-containing protein [Streptomyces olivoverticillatus]MBB4893693.1 uncharacterized protein YkwD [Streptomyces olivoverticillatus]